MKITYDELVTKIKNLELDLKLASTPEEISYFENELLVAEEYLAKTIDKGRE